MLKQKIAILGGAVFGYALDYENSVEDMVFKTVTAALKNCNMKREDVDVVIQAGDDVMDGIAINHVYTVEAAGSLFKEESKVERDGAWALQYAMARILSGGFKTALIVGFSKASQCSVSAFGGMIADPFYLRPVGVDQVSSAALQAAYASQAWGYTERDLAEIAATERTHGTRNPRATFAKKVTADDVEKSAPLATPLRELSAAEDADGCVAILVSTLDAVPAGVKPLATIAGVGFASHAYYPTYREFSKVESAEVAARAAYQMASVTADQIGIAELHAPYAHQTPLTLAALGFCDYPGAVKFAREADQNGRLALNRSGGALSGNPIYAAGLARIYEAALQLAGKSEYPTNESRYAVAHSQAGLAMQSNIVYVLEKA